MAYNGNGLGFDSYTSRYLAGVVSAGGTTPALLVQQAFQTLTTDVWLTFNMAPLAVYPYYGGVADSHAINLFGPKFTIAWNGSVTHGSNGVNSDGTTGYGETFVNLATEVSTVFSFGIYSRSNSASDTATDIGIAIGTNLVKIKGRSAAGLMVALCGGNVGTLSAAVAASTGLLMAHRTSATSSAIFRNGVVLDGDATSVTSLPNGGVDVMVAAGTGDFSTRQQAFAFISQRAFANNYLAFYNTVQAFQTVLARQV